MKILLATSRYISDSLGGVELYVQALGQGLRSLNYNVVIAAPNVENKPSQFVHQGLPVHLFPTDSNPSREVVQGKAPSSAHRDFEKWLAEERAHIFHVHSLSTPLNYFHIKSAYEQNLRCFLTLHGPEFLCSRNTLMKFGQKACGGRIVPRICTACKIEDLGYSKALSYLLGGATQIASSLTFPFPQSSRLSTLIDMPDSMRRKREQGLHLGEMVEKLIVHSHWLYEGLLKNGISRDQIFFCRYALLHSRGNGGPNPSKVEGQDSDKIKVGYLGRICPDKGTKVFLDASDYLPSNRVAFYLYGHPGLSREEEDYFQKIKKKADQKDNFHMMGKIPPSQVLSTMASLDLFCVPSVWMEAGPMVVLEAFEAGVPPLGSRLGGIQELIRDGVDGLLFHPGDARDLALKIKKVIENPSLLTRLKKNIRPPKKFESIVSDMVNLYERGRVKP